MANTLFGIVGIGIVVAATWPDPFAAVMCFMFGRVTLHMGLFADGKIERSHDI